MKPQKLELTWIGKDARPRLEPRILLEDPTKSHHAKQRVNESDIFDNRLIFGDNLLALKALEQEFAGKVKCVYIDPPFNTGVAFEHYDDGIEHSLWLTLMHHRFNLIRSLLSPDGILVVHLDDTESAYAKVLLDEVFGRVNYLNTVTTTTNAPSGFKATSSTIFSTANQLLFYAKDKSKFSLKRVFIEKGYDAAYSKYLFNRDSDYTEWKWASLAEVFSDQKGFSSLKEAKKELGEAFANELGQFAISNAYNVFRTAAIGGGAAIKRRITIEKSKQNKGRVFVHPNEDVANFYILNGEQFVFYDARLVEIDGVNIPGEIITDVWTDIPWTGIAGEGGVEFKNGKKPEPLIRRVLDMCTVAGDLVLDSFGGSGTTGAVAHKMGRRWIMVELGDHCHTHIIPRLQKVIDGEDKGGVTEATGWQGGGGFKYFSLAPSLLEKDRWGNWIISKAYNPAMLSQALCKLEGFTYAPSDTHYWQQGRSTETDFLYVTTQTLNVQMLQALSYEVGADRTLLICCSAFMGSADRYPNLTLKKIPKAVISKCEWGHDDYSLNVANLPMAAPRSAVMVKPKQTQTQTQTQTQDIAQDGLFTEGA